jgi:hypothetical protein
MLMQMEDERAQEDKSLRTPVEIRPPVTPPAWNLIIEVILTTAEGERAVSWRKLAAQFQRRNLDLAAAAVSHVLADLHLQGWRMQVDGHQLWVIPPLADVTHGERTETVKARLKDWLLAGRSAQISDPAVQAFIVKMQTPRVFQKSRMSVLDLVDDGHALAAELSEVARQPPSKRALMLNRIVRPRLEIVDAQSICSETGLPLLDVWRYFRHTWSIEYRPTPGRSLFFLIRNVARPNRPVMAIGSLANATLQNRLREDWIGWSAERMRERASRNPDDWQTIRTSLLETLASEIANIKADDLFDLVGNATGAPLEKRLYRIADEAKRLRKGDLRDRATRAARGEATSSPRRLPLSDDGTIAWEEAAGTHLFKAKRAKTLADLLFAQRILQSVGTGTESSAGSEEFWRAFGIACKEIRKVGLASRLLELNVCGAVPPYRDLLAGKLAALAAGSSEIQAAYTERYAGKVSEITSQMAGREVTRSSDICVIMTTSLYGLSASQYNRLNIRVPCKHGAHPVRWEDLGTTRGFGTTHFSEDTVTMLRTFSVSRRGGRNINNMFGEGQSPRLRQVREALDDLGLSSNGLLRHSTPRRVYALELFPGAREQLCLNKLARAAQPNFKKIADSWVERWLAKRITYRPALDRVATEGPETLRRNLISSSGSQLSLFANAAPKESPPAPIPVSRISPMLRNSNPTLIQGLYRAAAACADHHDPATVRLLHIETELDNFIRKRAKQGGILFVTGNPGDGKTHLLRRLETDLRTAGVEVHLDANEEDDDDLIKSVDAVGRGRKGGIAIAINEGILVSLLRKAKTRSWVESTRDLLINPYVFPGDRPAEHTDVCVVDLNLRNNLAPDTVRKALSALVGQSGPCDGCPVTTCGLQLNAERLRNDSIQRLLKLLDAVSKAGFHATMRDVQGFLAYILSGPYTCDDFKAGIAGRWYWENVFVDGQGPLFEAVRQFDPQDVTTPLLDDQLWREADNANDWFAPPPYEPPAEDTLHDQGRSFIARKRRALFEHRDAEVLLRASSSVLDKTVVDAMRPGTAGVRRVVRLLNQYFDRSESAADILYLWTTHRFDAQSNRYAASYASVPLHDFEMIVPRLRPEIASAFPNFYPSFSVLRLKGASVESGLRIDRALVQTLVAAEQGLPSPFRRGEPEARIAAFFDRMAKEREGSRDDLIEVRLVDMDNGANHRIGIDVRGPTYVRA